MEDMTAPSAEPAYLSRLALHTAPFGKQLPASGFFKASETEQRLNLLLHLLRASDKVVVLRAADGLGKTAMLDELQRRCAEDLRVCRLDASRALNLQELASRALQAFGVDAQAPESLADPQNSLRQHLSRLRQLGVTPVLLLDNVQLLAEPLLQTLTVWLGWQQQSHYLLQAVMTSDGSDSLPGQLESRLQLLDLPALPSSEIAAYLQTRLRAAGFSGDVPFNQQQLRRIYRQSAGVPLRINQLAHQYLLGHRSGLSLPALPQLPTVNWSLPFNRHWLWLLPLASLLILVLLNQQQINDWLQAGRSVDELNGEAEIVVVDALTEVIIDDQPLPQADQLEQAEFLDLLAELEQSLTEPAESETATQQTAEPLLEPALTIEPDADEVLPPTQSPPPEVDSVPADAAVAEAANDVEAVTEPSLQPLEAVNTVQSAVKQQDWILQQAATAYTYQLMGTWDAAEVDAFIDKYALSGDVAVFASMRNDRVWYALIYGVYANKQQAEAASKRWPAPLNTLPNWLRRYDSVQQQIRERSPID